MIRFREWLAELFLSDPAGLRFFGGLAVLIVLAAVAWEVLS